MSLFFLFASCTDASTSSNTPSPLLDATAGATVVPEKTTKATDTPKATNSPKPSATAKLDNTAAPPTQRPATSAPIATATTATAGATVTIVSVTSPISRGGTARLVAKGPPGAACRLAYTTPAGTPSTANGLGLATADSAGDLNWSWNISGSTNLGTGKVSLTCPGAPGISGTIVIQ